MAVSLDATVPVHLEDSFQRGDNQQLWPGWDIPVTNSQVIEDPDQVQDDSEDTVKIAFSEKPGPTAFTRSSKMCQLGSPKTVKNYVDTQKDMFAEESEKMPPTDRNLLPDTIVIDQPISELCDTIPVQIQNSPLKIETEIAIQDSPKRNQELLRCSQIIDFADTEPGNEKESCEKENFRGWVLPMPSSQLIEIVESDDEPKLEHSVSEHIEDSDIVESSLLDPDATFFSGSKIVGASQIVENVGNEDVESGEGHLKKIIEEPVSDDEAQFQPKSLKIENCDDATQSRTLTNKTLFWTPLGGSRKKRVKK